MRVRAHRAWLLLPAGIGLLAGIDAGLLLLEVPAPVGAGHLPDVHGPLMVLGFLGTLIALERAVALRAAVGYAAPALLGLGGLALAVGLPRSIGQVLLLDGSGRAGRRARRTLAPPPRRPRGRRGARGGRWPHSPPCSGCGWMPRSSCRCSPASWCSPSRPSGSSSPASTSPPRPNGCSSRSLLSSRPRPPARCSSPMPAPAPSGCRCWCWSAGSPRATSRAAPCAAPDSRGSAPRRCWPATAWLAVAGVAWALAGVTTTPAAHDVVVHTIFLGFVMSMVLAHAPVILPAVLRRPVPYRPLLWVPLVVLHVALLVRVAGDLADRPGPGRRRGLRHRGRAAAPPPQRGTHRRPAGPGPPRAEPHRPPATARAVLTAHPGATP